MPITLSPPATRRIRLALLTAALAWPSAALAEADAPVYPGAQEHHLPSSHVVHPGIVSCGHRITVVKDYRVAADPRAVAAWYAGRLPGARTFDLKHVSEDDGVTSLDVVSGDGARAIVVQKLNLGSSLPAAAAQMGFDKTSIGVEAVSPPFRPDELALFQRAVAGGPDSEAAKSQIKAQMEASCRR